MPGTREVAEGEGFEPHPWGKGLKTACFNRSHIPRVSIDSLPALAKQA